MSSTIQIPRPCVAMTSAASRGWIARSRTATFGISAPLYCAHCLPPSSEIQRPISVPTKRRSLLTRSSLTTWAYPFIEPSAGASAVHVLPKSVVR